MLGDDRGGRRLVPPQCIFGHAIRDRLHLVRSAALEPRAGTLRPARPRWRRSPRAGGGSSSKIGRQVRFSNRPSGSSTFRPSTAPGSMSLAGSRFSSDSAPRALPSWDSKTRWNNLSSDLAVNVTAGSSGPTNSPHPSSREGHYSTTQWSSSVPVRLDTVQLCHAATASRVQRNSVPSTQIMVWTGRALTG